MFEGFIENESAQVIQSLLGIPEGLAVALMFIFLIWSLVWKGLALWKSAKKGHVIWFIVFLVVNLAGIPEILYIFIFSKMMEKGKTENKPVKKSKVKSRPKKK